MKPTDDQLQQCMNALLSAFSLRELEQLVRADLNLLLVEISAIDSQAALDQVVEQLVRYYAAQEGGLQRLLATALRQDPANQFLSNLIERWRGLHFDPLPAPDPPRSEENARGVGHSKGISFDFDPSADGDYFESTSPDDPADMSFSFDPVGPTGGNVTNTSGGASVSGDAHVGRDLVGRDQYKVGEGGQVLIIQGDVFGDAALGVRGLTTNRTRPLIEEIIRLDVARPVTAFVDTIFDIAVSIRQPDAPKLAVEDLTEVTSDEGSIFRTEEDEVVSYRVEIVAPGCDVDPAHYIIKLRPGKDSRIYFYHITPRREGSVSILVNAYQVGDDALVAQTRLRLAVSLPVGPQPADVVLADLFTPLLQAIFLVVPNGEHISVHQKIVALQMELARGAEANDQVMAGLIQDLVDVAPDMAMQIRALFRNSSLDKLTGPTTRYVLERISG